MWKSFRNCPRLYWWRYVRCLQRIKKDKHRYFGGVVHDLLRNYYAGEGSPEEILHQAFPNREGNAQDRAQWHLARAMMQGYGERYADDQDFEIVKATEMTFSGDIVNPETGATSRSFSLDGKVDMIVQTANGRYWIFEHKTAQLIDAAYIEALWTDFQISLYSHYVSSTTAFPIAGIFYNMLGKAKLQQSEGETQEQFEIRRQELIAKSKTGKTSAKRRMPESDEAFSARLAEKYRQPSMFHREAILIPEGRVRMLQSQLWDLTQSLLEARRRDAWYQNEDHCYWFRRACEYLPLCRTEDPEPIIANLFEERQPHEELEDAETGEATN